MFYVNFPVKSLKIRSEMATFLFSTCFRGHLTIKVELIPGFYASAVVRYKTNKKELVKSIFLYFGLKEGQNTCSP